MKEKVVSRLLLLGTMLTSLALRPSTIPSTMISLWSGKSGIMDGVDVGAGVDDGVGSILMMEAAECARFDRVERGLSEGLQKPREYRLD